MSKKKILDYENKYGDISENHSDRLTDLFHKYKVNNKDISKIKKAINILRKNKFKRLNFIFYMLPEATPRPRSTMGGKIFYVKNAKDNSETFRKFIESEESLNFKITTPCRFTCVNYFPIPSGMNKVEGILAELGLIPKIGKPDWDNLGKTYSDMIQKHLLIEDSLIFDGRVIKKYSSKPRIEIYIEYMEDYDCKYHENKIKKWKTYSE